MPEVKIKVEIMKQGGSVVARATLEFPLPTDSSGTENGVLEIKGFQIMHDKYRGGLRVLPPSIKTKEGKYKPMSFVQRHFSCLRIFFSEFLSKLFSLGRTS